MSNRRIDVLLSKARALYIINDSGLLEHHEVFVDTDDDPDLFSALFATVHMYSRQLGGGDLELIALENHKFAFSSFEGNLIVLDVDVNMSKEDGIWLIGQIMDRFEDIKRLMEMDVEGGLILQTLFGERGKSITWDTIKAIKEEAIIEKLEQSDIVQTSNMTKINIRSKIWIKIRQIVSTLVNTQKDLVGLILIIKRLNFNNILFSGRVEPYKLDDIIQYSLEKINDPLSGAVLEAEKTKIGEYFTLIHPVLAHEGALLVIASKDSYTINHLTTHLERVVTALERLLGRQQ